MFFMYVSAYLFFLLFFFFKQKTAYEMRISDWSSDVCSSDLDLTIRQLAASAGSYAGLAFVGTPDSIADEMEAWLEERASDGFNMMFPWLPGGLDDFTGRVVPELQRRGIFRTEYEGSTLRDHLGLPRPENRFFATGQAPGAFQPPLTMIGDAA